MDIAYKPDGEQLKQFMLSNDFFRGIRGPVGSGKTAGCCVEIMRRATQQEAGPDGIRKSRWAIVRNTNPQLRTTTIKTWLDWFPENIFGKFIWSVPYTHRVRYADVELEVLFLALDRPEDVKKLLSLELTGIFFNEAREIEKDIIDAGTMRVGRFPSMKDGGPTWYGIIADTNAPGPDHWWPIMAGDIEAPPWLSLQDQIMLVKPEGWSFYTQPGAMKEVFEHGKLKGYKANPKGENRKNLDSGYYSKIIRGKSKEWIDVYVLNRVGEFFEGQAVTPAFNRDVHVAEVAIPFIEGETVYIGMDFGRTPAAMFWQHVNNQWRALHEIVTDNADTKVLARVLKQDIALHCPSSRLILTGDPAGHQGSQADSMTPFLVLEAEGIFAEPAFTNDPEIRRIALNDPIQRMVNGEPGLVVSPGCTVFIAGLAGGWHFPRLNVSGEALYKEIPLKNRYSHVCEAAEYGLMGGGEGERVFGSTKKVQTVQAKTGFDPFDRTRRRRPSMVRHI